MAMQSGFIKRIRDIMRMDAGINGDAQRIEQMVPGLRFYRLPRRSKERPADRAREAGAECACYRP